MKWKAEKESDCDVLWHLPGRMGENDGNLI
jgi:hypothetical protein